MIHARSKIGTPQPPATRRKLDRVGVLLCHQVGVLTAPNGRYRSSDPARVLDDARAAAGFGISSGRSWEYSYIIGLDGSIFEQAGEYMAQHCLNFNTESAGVLLLNANDVPANAAQIESWHRLRAHMVTVGTLSAEHIVAPHYRYRSTQCCGIHAEPPGRSWNSPTGEGRLGNLIPELVTAPVKPPAQEDDEVNRIGYVRLTGTTGVYEQWSNGTKTWVRDGDVLAVLRFLDPDMQITELPNAAWMRAAGPIVGPIPAGVDGWGVPL